MKKADTNHFLQPSFFPKRMISPSFGKAPTIISLPYKKSPLEKTVTDGHTPGDDTTKEEGKPSRTEDDLIVN